MDERHFQAKAQLRDVGIEPEHAIAMAKEPTAARALTAKIQSLPVDRHEDPARSRFLNHGRPPVTSRRKLVRERE